MTFYHWRCDCGAHGYSNELDANFLIIGMHRDRGHKIQCQLAWWQRLIPGWKKRWQARIYAALTPGDTE